MKVLLIAGARPNFMKVAPIYRAALNLGEVDCRLVHTGQHYDYEMSEAFFRDLEMPKPDYFLDAGSGSHAVQTAKIMVAFEAVCDEHRPDLVMVVGDVNSTLACSVVAKKLGIQVAHVEAGLRSFDLSMPEEINRMVTDAITDFFFVTEQSGVDNLLREGKPKERIHFVGHVMIDNLLYQLQQLENGSESRFATHGLKEGNREYIFLTLHRPANVDDEAKLSEIAGSLNEIAGVTPILFPVHPRTKKMLEAHRVRLSPNIIQLPPLGFKESLYLWKDALLVMTDSGGLQEETTALGVPCITLRDNTERPITIEMGTNRLAGTTREGIIAAFRAARDLRTEGRGQMTEGGIEKAEGRKRRGYRVPPLWDGKASERIWEVLLMTEGGGRKTDDRRQNRENRGRTAEGVSCAAAMGWQGTGEDLGSTAEMTEGGGCLTAEDAEKSAAPKAERVKKLLIQELIPSPIPQHPSSPPVERSGASSGPSTGQEIPRDPTQVSARLHPGSVPGVRISVTNGLPYRQ